jgi:hypothetical protein
MQSLAKSLSLSDRGLAKICAAANIPVPARGYWAKKQAGKRVDQIRLPARGLGQSDTVHIGGDRHSDASEDAEILSAPIPPPPVFEPDMTTVQAQATARPDGGLGRHCHSSRRPTVYDSIASRHSAVSVEHCVSR